MGKIVLLLGYLPRLSRHPSRVSWWPILKNKWHLTLNSNSWMPFRLISRATQQLLTMLPNLKALSLKTCSVPQPKTFNRGHSLWKITWTYQTLRKWTKAQIYTTKVNQWPQLTDKIRVQTLQWTSVLNILQCLQADNLVFQGTSQVLTPTVSLGNCKTCCRTKSKVQACRFKT